MCESKMDSNIVLMIVAQYLHIFDDIIINVCLIDWLKKAAERFTGSRVAMVVSVS